MICLFGEPDLRRVVLAGAGQSNRNREVEPRFLDICRNLGKDSTHSHQIARQNTLESKAEEWVSG
jgi:hypothetical protein